MMQNQFTPYKLGRYHAVIEKVWDDGTITYEVKFSSCTDFAESRTAVMHCFVHQIPCGATEQKKMTDVRWYIGSEAKAKINDLNKKDC